MRCKLPAAAFFFLGLAMSIRAGEEPKFKLSADEQKIVDLTNAARKKEELPPLAPNPILFKAARAHSANMAKQQKMEHELDGKTPFDRIKDAGYKPMRGGENIAMGDAEITIAEIFQGWMDSKGHRENILKKEFTEIGVGLVKGKDGSIYYTQVFGTPRKK